MYIQDCDHECGGCDVENCSSRIEKISTEPQTSIKHVIGIISGKGGVGKSLITTLLSVYLSKNNKKTSILDADVTGPSITKGFGIKDKVLSDGKLLYPAYSNKYHIGMISANMCLENEEDPIIWRGVLLGNLVKQFYSDVYWGKLDYLLIDMPPGTGDIALTTFQSIPIDGIIVVSTPQNLVKGIVVKAIKMANEMNIPILGIVENMAYVECKNCKEKNYVFGKSNTLEICKEYNIKFLGQIPLREDIASKIDGGFAEDIEISEFENIVKEIDKD